ncbi:MAG: roadblock/LC7 domain-containing protein [Candidatus Helarchaeales archaeon]
MKRFQRFESLIRNMANPLNKMLKETLEKSQDMLAISIVSRDGLIIANALENGYNEELLAGMAAQMTMLGDRVVKELFNRKPDKFILESGPYVVILIEAGQEALVMSITLKRSFGISLMIIERMAKKVEEFFDG